jgi:hypothetical protein
MVPFPFSRVLVVNSKSIPDASLLEYAAMLASCTDGPATWVAGPAASGLEPISRAFLEPAGVSELSVSLLPDLHLDAVFGLARDNGCDLMVLRHPRHSSATPVLLRRLLFLAPCAVCLVPEGAPPSIVRPLIRLSFTTRGARLLTLAAAVTRHSGAEEFVAVHNFFDYDVDEQPDLSEKFRTRDELEIYRFLARADLSGANCTPVRASHPSETHALLELAAKRQVDLLIVDPAADGSPIWQWNRREARRLAGASPVPVLSTGLAEAHRNWSSVLREQVFTQPEPKFN